MAAVRARSASRPWQQEVGELALLCRALVHVLGERGGLDPEALRAALERMDAEDGVIDGRVTPEDDRPKPQKPPATAHPTPKATRPWKRST